MPVLARCPETPPSNPVWITQFLRPDLRVLTRKLVPPSFVVGEARPRLVSRSGFEQKHIRTSQIASG
jgi:hypothetical protein